MPCVKNLGNSRTCVRCSRKKCACVLPGQPPKKRRRVGKHAAEPGPEEEDEAEPRRRQPAAAPASRGPLALTIVGELPSERMLGSLLNRVNALEYSQRELKAANRKLRKEVREADERAEYATRILYRYHRALQGATFTTHRQVDAIAGWLGLRHLVKAMIDIADKRSIELSRAEGRGQDLPPETYAPGESSAPSPELTRVIRAAVDRDHASRAAAYRTTMEFPGEEVEAGFLAKFGWVPGDGQGGEESQEESEEDEYEEWDQEADPKGKGKAVPKRR